MRHLVGLVLFYLGVLQGALTLTGIDGLSLSGRRRRLGYVVFALLLVGGLVALVLAPLLLVVLMTLPALALALGILFAVSFFLRRDFAPPTADVPGVGDPWTAEPVVFQDQIGAAGGLFLRARHPNGATVCWVHGVGDDKRSYKWVIARALTRRGFNLLTFDLPGHGERSAEPFSLPAGLSVVPAALAYLRQRGDVDPNRIGLLGVSMGGALSIRALAAGQRVDALVLLETPCELGDMEAYRCREAIGSLSWPALNAFRDCSLGGLHENWRPQGVFAPDLKTVFNQLRPDEYIADLPAIPVLVVSGGRDSICLPEHSARLFERAKAPKAFEIIRPASHVSLIFMRKPADLAAGWFARYL